MLKPVGSLSVPVSSSSKLDISSIVLYALVAVTAPVSLPALMVYGMARSSGAREKAWEGMKAREDARR